MELDDSAFPLLTEVVCTDDADVAFGDVDVALLVGAMPRKDGMDRSDLLAANGGIFKPQGEALSRSAKRDVKVLVVGNPANTNALIAMSNAADLDPSRFTAMTRLDHNRAKSQLAAKLGVSVNDITKMTIWGNHSNTQYPDLFHCEVNGAVGVRRGRRSRLVRRRVHPDRRDPRWSDHQGPRARHRRPPPRTLQSITSVRGRSVRQTATGSRWECGRTGATACPRASSRVSRACAETAATRSCRVWTSTTSAGSGSTLPPRSWSASVTRSATSV